MSTINQQTVLEFMRGSLQGFSAAMFPEYRPSQHHKLLADRLEAIESGRLKRLVVLMPPRHGKSKTASELFPAWLLGRNPKRRIMALCYGQELSDTFGRSVRNYLKSQTFSSLFPECKISSDSNSVRRFNTTLGGSYTGVGVGGPATGKGADVILLDDVLKNREEADSPIYRANLIGWYKGVVRTRLQPGGSIALIQTRWGTSDFVQWLLSETAHENWEVISLPAIALDNDPLGRQPGEALWPESYPLPVLEEIRQTLGSRDWTALYQQTPLSNSDVIFSPKWLQFYDRAPEIGDFIHQSQPLHTDQPLPPTPKNRIVHSWDLSFGGTSLGSSWVVGQTWLIQARQKYLLHMVREQLSFSDSLSAIRAMVKTFPPTEILIENKASGSAVIDVLRAEIGYKLISINPTTSKSDRAYACVPQFERGEIWLPNPKLFYWVKPLLTELQSFPQSATDDCVDSMTQLLNWVEQRFRSEQQQRLPPNYVTYNHLTGRASYPGQPVPESLSERFEREQNRLSPYEHWKRRQQQ